MYVSWIAPVSVGPPMYIPRSDEIMDEPVSPSITPPVTAPDRWSKYDGAVPIPRPVICPVSPVRTRFVPLLDKYFAPVSPSKPKRVLTLTDMTVRPDVVSVICSLGRSRYPPASTMVGPALAWIPTKRDRRNSRFIGSPVVRGNCDHGRSHCRRSTGLDSKIPSRVSSDCNTLRRSCSQSSKRRTVPQLVVSAVGTPLDQDVRDRVGSVSVR